MNDQYNFPPLQYEAEDGPHAGRPIFDGELYRALTDAHDVDQCRAYQERFDEAQEVWEEKLQARCDAADALLPPEELARLKLDRAWGSFNFMLRMQSGFGISREYAESLCEVQAKDPNLQQDRVTRLIENLVAESEPESVLYARFKAYQDKMNRQDNAWPICR